MIEKSRKIISLNSSLVDSTTNARITVLENNEYKIAYFESVSSASGTVTPPTGATILTDQFFGGIDAYVSTISNGQPTGIYPQTAGGVTVDVSSFDALGNYVLTGTPSSFPVAIIYVFKIKAINYSNVNLSRVLDLEQIGIRGTTDRITVTSGKIIDIAATYVGQASITTVATLTSGATGAGFTIALGTSTVTGVLPAANGGTGQSSYTVGDLIYASTTTALSKLAAGASGTFLRFAGTGTAPTVSTLTLPNTATANRILYATGSNAIGTATNFNFNGTQLAVGTFLGQSLGATAILNLDSTGGSANTIVCYNSTTTAFNGWLFEQSSTKWGRLGRWNTSYPGNYDGTTMPFADSFSFQSGSGNDLPFVISSSTFCAFSGATGTNSGIRSDSTGFRIDTINALQSTNGFRFEVNGTSNFKGGTISIVDQNVSFGTTTGTKFGTATSQKMAFWNKTPIVQPTTAITGASYSAVGGSPISTNDTFGGYTIAQLAAIIINTGLGA